MLKKNIGWYDIKTKFKQLLRRITYSYIFQELLSYLVILYMKFVYYSSKKTFINSDILLNAAKNKEPLIMCFWHNRLLMAPFIALRTKKACPNYNFMILASKHGDGKIIGNIMEKLGLISILGSSQNKRKSSRGIDIASFRNIFNGLKKGYSFGITPDGPRGPNQKINGEVLNIARLAKAKIIASSCSTSRFKIFNSWDKFKFPLPFSNICYYLDENAITVSKDDTKEDIEAKTIELEEKLNFVQDQSLEVALNKM